MLPYTVNGGWLRPLLRGTLGTILLGCPLFIVALRCEAQNLVPNPSFEVVDSCPQYPAVLGYQPGATPQHWFSFSETPDYFNACVDSAAGVPMNLFGFQQPFEGQAYSGMWTFQSEDHREMIGAALLSPLTVGETYYVSFWSNAAYGGNQTMDVGSNNLGVLFTVNPYMWVYPMPEFGLRNLAQAFSPTVLTDTMGWTLVSGVFVADSAYQYVVLGNHFSNNYSDTLSIGPGQLGMAYSFVDMVCVSQNALECALLTGFNDGVVERGALGPNPVSNELQVWFGGGYHGEVYVLDPLGRCIWQGRGNGTDRALIAVGHWAKGQYVVHWNAESGRRSLKFVVTD